MQFTFLQYGFAQAFVRFATKRRNLPVSPALPLDGDRVVVHRQQAEQHGATDAADHGTEWHEGEEHQHAAITFEISGFEDFDPGEPGSDAERGSTSGARRSLEPGIHNYKRPLGHTTGASLNPATPMLPTRPRQSGRASQSMEGVMRKISDLENLPGFQRHA
jgi:hypothetical protein